MEILMLYNAHSFADRLRGLLFRRRLKSCEAMWLSRCRAVHTFGMGYPLDLVFLDKHNRVLKIMHNVAPARIIFCWRARSVIELNAGYCYQHPAAFMAGQFLFSGQPSTGLPFVVFSEPFTMNKAFVKESDHDDEEDLEPEAIALPQGSKNYMTKSGYHRLRAELVHLMNEERPKVVQVVSWAASNGDRSENGDYIYGKKRLREIDRRIRFLTKRLEAAEVVDPSLQPNRDQVFFGATVVYCDKAGTDHRVTIVGVDEADPLNNMISWISPVARALLKAREGDTVTLRTPAGLDELDVLEVIYPDPAQVSRCNGGSGQAG
ncbi:MAG: transcription elongation factor GreB [Pusillimonas sp.]|nr:transcription elongation factor GreB [Pusillimonas sp.]